MSNKIKEILDEIEAMKVKHAKKIAYRHDYYDEFLLYGDEDEYQKKLEVICKKFQKSNF